MNKSITENEFKLFSKFIEDNCGIEISHEKAYLIETRLSSLLHEFNLNSFEELFHTIRNISNKSIIEKIINQITTNETSWFRDKTPWKIIENHLFDGIINKIKKNQKVRIWSAAASSGQEIYSTVMSIYTLIEKLKLPISLINNFEFLATDISTSILNMAKQAKYDPITIMRGLPVELKQKFFIKENSSFILSDKIKNLVTFKQFNLQNSFLTLGHFDIIFCRYVMIYFSDSLKFEILRKLNNSLSGNISSLFIGSSEIHPNIENYFEKIYSEGGIYYKKKVIF